MKTPLIAIFATIFLDAIGLGIIFPVLPDLLKDILSIDGIAIYLGGIATVYALMQFIFSPLLGALSDRIGRRTVLLLSLGGSVVSYFFMSIATTLPLLIMGRVVAGITSANMPVALAFITDISAPEKRAKYFGLFNAMFGMGLIFGPVLGGFLGELDIRLPFLIAALMNFCNFILVLLVLPETRQTQRDKAKQDEVSTNLSLRELISCNGILPILGIFFILSFAGDACVICWAMWGHDSFGWNSFYIGLSLGLFGLCQVFAQIFLPEYFAKLLGEKRAALMGILALCVALCFMALATESWIVFAVIPLLSLGGISSPALQVIATRLVDSQSQGQLQGLLSSALSLSSVIAPLFFSILYSTIREVFPGGIWLAAIAINMTAIPLILYGLKGSQQQRTLT